MAEPDAWSAPENADDTDAAPAVILSPASGWEQPEALAAVVAAGAQHCLVGLVYGSVIESHSGDGDLCLRLVARDRNGERQPQHDLRVEVFRSGDGFSLTFERIGQPDWPLLWYGRHPVWMRADSGRSCERPAATAARQTALQLEALARRLRMELSALLG